MENLHNHFPERAMFLLKMFPEASQPSYFKRETIPIHQL